VGLDGEALKIVFFNRFFHPDTSATSQIVSDLAFHLASRGHEVHAVTARVPEAMQELEVTRGVTIHRVATASSGPQSLVARGFAYLDYYRGARRAVKEIVGKGDIVVAKTDPPMLSAAVGALARRRGAKFVAWLQDVFPEVAREYGVPGMGWPLGTMLKSARDSSLVNADRVVVIGERMAGRIAEIPGMHRDRVRVIHNWADGGAIVPVEAGNNALRKQWNLEDKFVVGYSGNLGRVHEFETLLAAAALLKGDPGIAFVIIGRGPRLAEVRVRVEQQNLDNVRFESHQPREALAQSLGVPDAHVCVLRPEFEGLVHPSKLYGILAAGRPTLFVGDVKGECAAILARTKTGLSVGRGDAEGLVAAIRTLREDASLRASMGSAARHLFEGEYSMAHALDAWDSLLGELDAR
jgi:glycosyltransferase involved in cell wall biosynthesis